MEWNTIIWIVTTLAGFLVVLWEHKTVLKYAQHVSKHSQVWFRLMEYSAITGAILFGLAKTGDIRLVVAVAISYMLLIAYVYVEINKIFSSYRTLEKRRPYDKLISIVLSFAFINIFLYSNFQIVCNIIGSCNPVNALTITDQ
jgi:hypothetical protein